MQILFVFILKIIDNALSTAKTIYINKERYVLGSILNAFATFFYLVAIVQIAKSSDMKSIIAMCIATFIGTYLPGVLIKKSERDKLYIYDITAPNLNAGKLFADLIRDNDIAIRTSISYDSDMKKVLSCKVFCSSKEESRFINSLIPPTFKYHVFTPLDI